MKSNGFQLLFEDIRSDQDRLHEAEGLLLHLADYAYTRTSLKPMSKALFFLSRCLLLASTESIQPTARSLTSQYRSLCTALGANAPADDYSFSDTVDEVAEHLPHLIEKVARVQAITSDDDTLGMAFDTLLRGKWESGEGLGTFLTPEEIVAPMVSMATKAMPPSIQKTLHGGKMLFGDICGGTGRFVFHISRLLLSGGAEKTCVEKSARLFDQSRMSVDFAKINFAIQGLRPSFASVSDSLTCPDVSALRHRFALLATNPPFGLGKYRITEAVARELPTSVLHAANLGVGHAADPAFLFTFRNLDLLADGGVLAIVLPDGVLQSATLPRALGAFEEDQRTHVDLLASVSLPPNAFALGGTVAKTSFAIFCRRTTTTNNAVTFAQAKHIGFVKRGNRRANDPRGNDLEKIANSFDPSQPATDKSPSWRDMPRFMPRDTSRDVRLAGKSRLLSKQVHLIREFTNHVVKTGRFHVSVLDVDETGLIDIVASSRNAPTTRCMIVESGDILFSCLNPRIWRVTMIPLSFGEWTCSAEFAVLRPVDRKNAVELFLGLQHASVRDQVAELTGGTSSSRQRVSKDELLGVRVPKITTNRIEIERMMRQRERLYRSRLDEALAFTALANGSTTFLLGRVHA